MSDYKADLLCDLRDADYAAAYLTAAILESSGAFLVALRDVVEARQGMGKTAARAGVNRENFYRMLTEEGNPTLRKLMAIADAIGLRIEFKPVATPEIKATRPKRTARAHNGAAPARTGPNSGRNIG